jgi:hypothetical protein
MAQRKTGVLHKLVEQFWKTVNMDFGQNAKNLHIKVSQTKFRGLLWIKRNDLIQYIP